MKLKPSTKTMDEPDKLWSDQSSGSNYPYTLTNDLIGIFNVQGIDKTTLQLCFKLIDQGIDPQSLATAILKIQDETRSVIP
ncbi:uncharacterized protein PRCAT00002358001 [Priceomyces carsonii]|uniref:uncharacterized protein n=1 Tax=Priceomyces carsonii TaxID=28549 RepID=UPI002EDAD6D0|nr:unnamed protein product [Priceomyces carsonii]